MNIVAGTFRSQTEARTALIDVAKLGIARVSMKVIDSNDHKGLEREHRSTRAAAQTGAFAGGILGILIFGFLLWLAGVDMLALRFITLYLGGIAMCTVGGASISALWNMGVSHDEALLYDEANEKRLVIAAVEVAQTFEDPVKSALRKNGAVEIRSGIWQPSGWTHTHPVYGRAA